MSMMMFKVRLSHIADHPFNGDRESGDRPDRQASGQHEPQHAGQDIGPKGFEYAVRSSRQQHTSLSQLSTLAAGGGLVGTAERTHDMNIRHRWLRARDLNPPALGALSYRDRRKLIITPVGAAVPPRKPARDERLIKALVKAHRWWRQIESGRAKSITDLAEQEGVTDAYVCRLLPLTGLAPDIVEAILDGQQPKGLRLADVLGNGPLDWDEQRSAPGSSRKPAL
jgi:hypothetical protein